MTIVPAMTEAIAEPRDEALEAARWDLQPLVDGRGADGVLALMAEAQEVADAFAERYRGKVAELDAAGLAEALHDARGALGQGRARGLLRGARLLHRHP